MKVMIHIGLDVHNDPIAVSLARLQRIVSEPTSSDEEQ